MASENGAATEDNSAETATEDRWTDYAPRDVPSPTLFEAAEETLRFLELLSSRMQGEQLSTIIFNLANAIRTERTRRFNSSRATFTEARAKHNRTLPVSRAANYTYGQRPPTHSKCPQCDGPIIQDYDAHHLRCVDKRCNWHAFAQLPTRKPPKKAKPRTILSTY